MSHSAASPNDRELSSADAVSAAWAAFRDFDRRVANQRVLDSHAVDSAKSAPVTATETQSEALGEGAR